MAAVARWNQLQREDEEEAERQRELEAERERKREDRLQQELKELRTAAARDRANIERAGAQVADELRELRELRDAAANDRSNLEAAVMEELGELRNMRDTAQVEQQRRLAAQQQEAALLGSIYESGGGGLGGGGDFGNFGNFGDTPGLGASSSPDAHRGHSPQPGGAAEATSTSLPTSMIPELAGPAADAAAHTPGGGPSSGAAGGAAAADAAAAAAAPVKGGGADKRGSGGGGVDKRGGGAAGAAAAKPKKRSAAPKPPPAPEPEPEPDTPRTALRRAAFEEFAADQLRKAMQAGEGPPPKGMLEMSWADQPNAVRMRYERLAKASAQKKGGAAAAEGSGGAEAAAMAAGEGDGGGPAAGRARVDFMGRQLARPGADKAAPARRGKQPPPPPPPLGSAVADLVTLLAIGAFVGAVGMRAALCAPPDWSASAWARTMAVTVSAAVSTTVSARWPGGPRSADGGGAAPSAHRRARQLGGFGGIGFGSVGTRDEGGLAGYSDAALAPAEAPAVALEAKDSLSEHLAEWRGEAEQAAATYRAALSDELAASCEGLPRLHETGSGLLHVAALLVLLLLAATVLGQLWARARRVCASARDDAKQPLLPTTTATPPAAEGGGSGAEGGGAPAFEAAPWTSMALAELFLAAYVARLFAADGGADGGADGDAHRDRGAADSPWWHSAAARWLLGEPSAAHLLALACSTLLLLAALRRALQIFWWRRRVAEALAPPPPPPRPAAAPKAKAPTAQPAPDRGAEDRNGRRRPKPGGAASGASAAPRRKSFFPWLQGLLEGVLGHEPHGAASTQPVPAAGGRKGFARGRQLAPPPSSKKAMV